MTNKEIKKEVKKLRRFIEQMDDRLLNIQAICKHKKTRVITGLGGDGVNDTSRECKACGAWID